MATRKSYAYQIKGNKISLLENQFGYGSGQDVITVDGSSINHKQYTLDEIGPTGKPSWVSPASAVEEGIEIEYAYSPLYQLPSTTEPGDNLASIDAWTIVDGYLTICSTNKNFTGSPWADNGLLAVNKYILIENMSPWNGIHKVQAIENPHTDGASFGGIKTFTTVNQFNPMWTGTAEISDDETWRIKYGIFKVGDYVWSTGSNAIAKNNGLFLVSDVVEVGETAINDIITVSTRYGRGSLMGSPYDEAFQENAADFTADSSGAHYLRKAYKAGLKSRFIWGINFIEDESFELDLPPYLSKALVYYLKAKQAEENLDIERKEYFMREFKKIVEKHESSKISGPRRIMGFGMTR